MADNILTTDRADADLDIAAKEIGAVKYPRNIITDPAGNDLTPLTDAALRATPVPVSGTVIVTGVATQTTLAALLAAVATDSTLAAGISALLSALGAPLQAGGNIGNIAGTVSLPTGAASETTLAAASAKLPASLGPKAGGASLSVVEATPTTVTIVGLQTNATGTTFNAFGSQACQMLDIVNTAPAAVDLEVRRGGSGNTIVVPAGSSRMFVGLANASDLQVRRLDQSNSQVVFTGEAVAQ
jgi:hypothetical protein